MGLSDRSGIQSSDMEQVGIHRLVSACMRCPLDSMLVLSVFAGAHTSVDRRVNIDWGWVLMQAALRVAGPLRGDPERAALHCRGRSDRGRPAPVPDAHPF